jgi:hypothetical protein
MLGALRGSCLTGIASLLPAAPAAAATAGPETSVAAARPKASVVCTVSDPRITEASGMAVSRKHPGIIYTHNDSGGSPTIFAIGRDGRTRATFTLAGAGARDWEGMALGRDGAGRPALFVADIGDNMGGAWPYVTVYRVPEPNQLRSQTLRATAFRLKYADGPRNAETVLIDPRTNRLYIASKLFGGALYAAPMRLRTSGFNVLRKVAGAPAIATDGAFAPDGRSFVIRTYTAAYVYAMSPSRPGKLLRVVSLPDQRQGESIAYSLDGGSLLAGSEGTDEPVWRIPLPPEARPTPTPARKAPTSSKSPAAQDQPGRRPGGTVLGLALAAGVAMVVAVVVIRRRS